MKENKKKSNKAYRGAKHHLKEEQHDKNVAKKQKNANDKSRLRETQEIKVIKKREQLYEQKELERQLKIDNRRKTIAKLKDKDKLEKFDKRQANKNQKRRIAHINRLNKKPKGLKFIPNSSEEIIIDVKNVVKSYTTKSLVFNALDGVNVKIKRGEFVAILGPSGSGKSTLLNVISGLDRPTTGEVIIDGENISALSDSWLTKLRRDKIGFVFQSYNLLPTLNVADNVEIGRSLQINKSKRSNIDKILTNIGINDQKKKRTHELSGGQQQRVSIARAISKAPEILIGDEPTGALDTKSRTEVFKLFQEINKRDKTTIIIVTHNPMIARLATKVIKVRDGKIDKIIINKKPEDASILAKHYE